MARSLVAGVNALFRREELCFPPERRLVDDPFAGRLVERDPLIAVIRALRFLIPPLRRAVDELRTAHCVRHAAVDALVREALERGVEQVVILGAGYDMRAARLGVGRPAVRWFEVDRPALLARKARLLGELPEGLGPLTRVGVDLAVDPLLARLVAAGFEPARSTLLVLEGLIHYLPREATEAILAALLAGGERRVVLTYIDPDMVGRASGTFRNLVRALREIPRTFYSDEEIARMGARHGLSRLRVLDWERQLHHAPAAAGRPVGVYQRVAALDPPEPPGAERNRPG